MATYTPLSTDFKDDILASQNSKRKYTQVNNSDGTVSFQDSTAYSQVGSSYGAKEVNEEREAINNIYANKLVTLDEIDLVTEPGFFVDAQVVKELNSKTIQIIKNNDSQQIYDLCGGKIRVVSGSAVKNVRGIDYICLVDKDELNEIFGQSYSITRLSIVTCNGDNEATNTRFLGAEIWQGHIYQYFAQKLSCSVRINYRIVYTYP